MMVGTLALAFSKTISCREESNASSMSFLVILFNNRWALLRGILQLEWELEGKGADGSIAKV